MCFYDKFTNPSFEPDVVIPTDDVVDLKYQMYNCYVSQVYEWLPWTNGLDHLVPKNPEERLDWLREPRVPRDGTLLREEDLDIFNPGNNSEYREATPAVLYREKLLKDMVKKQEELFLQRRLCAQNTVKS